MKLYSVCGKKIICDDDLRIHVCPILGLSVDELIDKGVIEPAEPTVEDCVRLGRFGLAVVLYEQIHNCDIVPAFEAVENIKKNLKE